MRFQCANCKHVLRADEDKMGKAVACENCGCAVAVPPERFGPDVVVGDFRIVRRIGEGAVGAVYFSHQISLDRPAALKILHARFAEDVDYRNRFLQEARTAAKINHPGIVQAYAVGEDEGVYFFAMEYIEGSTLKNVLAHSGSVMVQRAVTIIHGVAEALDFAWTNAKLVHRDIKPDNIILGEDGNVKLADLGLAKFGGDMLNEDSENVFGTPQYIAPEQLMGEQVDCRTDIYSLGATFYQLVTGRYPYTGGDPGEISRKHLYETLTPPKKLFPELPENVSLLIQVMMCKRAASRYQTPAELLKDLERISDGKAPERELPPDSQELFPPTDEERRAGETEKKAGSAETVGRAKLKLKRPTGAAASSSRAGATGGGRSKVRVRTKSRVKATEASGEPFEGDTPKKRGRKWWILFLLLLLAGGVGVAAWMIREGNRTGEQAGDPPDKDKKDSIVETVEKQIAAGKDAEALETVRTYLVEGDSLPAEATELRALAAPLLEEEVRSLRAAEIKKQRDQWTQRSEELVAKAEREAERARQLELEAERQREEEAERRRQEEARQKRLASLNEKRDAIRRDVVTYCRQKDYSRARLAVVPLKGLPEEEFSNWATNMERIVQLARECFETVSGAEDQLKGVSCNPANWPQVENAESMTVDYVGTTSIMLRYVKKIYKDGIFDRRESGVQNVKFTAISPPAMGRLAAVSWQRSNRGDAERFNLVFAAYLTCEAKAPDEAKRRLEAATSPIAKAILREIEALRKRNL